MAQIFSKTRYRVQRGEKHAHGRSWVWHIYDKQCDKTIETHESRDKARARLKELFHYSVAA